MPKRGAKAGDFGVRSRLTAVRRRRRMGGFSPVQISGLAGWWDFSDASTLYTDAGVTLVTGDGDAIYQANDKSGNGKHVLNATGAAVRPTYKVNIQNGRSVARFDGGDSLKSGAFTAMAQPNTVFVVGKSTATPAANRLMVSGTAASHAVYSRDLNEEWTVYAGTEASSGVAVDTSLHVFAAVVNGASSKFWIGGGASVALNPGTNTLGTTFSIGASDTPNQQVTGDICEVLLYAGALDTANVQLIGSYLGTRWGLTWAVAS